MPLNMSPVSFIDNGINSWFRYIKSYGHFNGRNNTMRCTNKMNILFRQFCSSVIYSFKYRHIVMTQTKAKSTFMILATSNIFQITQSIISFYSVNVINFMSRWALTNKSRTNKTMYRRIQLNFVFVESYAGITPPTKFCFPKFAIMSNPHISKITDFISVFVSNNWFPVFNHTKEYNICS